MHLLLLFSAFFYSILLSFITLGIFRTGRKMAAAPRGISVIIAARNEATNLPGLLESLQELNYPSEFFEIIIVDDCSQDDTASIIESAFRTFPNLRLIRRKDERPDMPGKKGALFLGIDKAQYEILAFTDADCRPGCNWLAEINSHFLPGIDFVAGYSPLLIRQKILSGLKNLERASIFAIIAGSFGWNWGFTSVARNQSYSKSVFQKISGFSGIGHLRSGDDDLLLQKIQKINPGLNFMFSQESIVPTLADQQAAQQVSLETRRASKWRYYPGEIKIMSLLVFLFHLLLAVTIALTICRLITPQLLLTALILKILPDFLLLTAFLVRIKRIKLMLFFPLAELVYIPYFLFFALKGTFGRYAWRE